MQVDIYDIDGTIQSRSAKIKRLRKLYSRSDEDKIYKKAIELLNKAFPNLVRLDEISILQKKGRVFLTEYDESAHHRGEQYGKTADVSTEFPIFNGEIDLTMLHELIHKFTFVKGIITEEDFEKNSAFYEGATELTAQKAFQGLKKESTMTSGYKVNLSGDVAYTNQVALLQQLDLLLGGDFVERSILVDKDALKNEMIAQFGEENYTFIWNRIADTRNATNDLKLIGEAIDDVQRAIIENCLPQKLKTLKTKEDFENFFETVRAIGDVRLTDDKNAKAFFSQYEKFITYARRAAEIEGLGTEFLDKYAEYKRPEYDKTDELYLAMLASRKSLGIAKEHLLFENANNAKRYFMGDELGCIPENVDVFADFSRDEPMVVMFRDGELISMTRRGPSYGYDEDYTCLNTESYAAYVGRAAKDDETAKRIFELEDASSVYKVNKSPAPYSYSEKEKPVDDYYLVKDDDLIAVINNTRGQRRTRRLTKLGEKEKAEVFDAIRSSIEIPQYFKEQKRVLEKTMGYTFYREDR